MPQIGKITFECLRDLFKINKIKLAILRKKCKIKLTILQNKSKIKLTILQKGW